MGSLASNRCWDFASVPSNVGALIIRIGFWEFLIIFTLQYTPNPIKIIKAATAEGLRVWSLQFRVQGFRFRVWSLGFKFEEFWAGLRFS